MYVIDELSATSSCAFRRIRLSRRDRQGCDYDAYLPDPLAGWELVLPADLVADLSDAEAAIRRLNATGTSHVSLEGLARFLLRAESVASSKLAKPTPTPISTSWST